MKICPHLASPPLAEVVPNDPHQHRDYWGLPRQLSPLASHKQGRMVLHPAQADGHEELFRLRDDPKEQRNLAGDPFTQVTLARMRAVLDRLTAGPAFPPNGSIRDDDGQPAAVQHGRELCSRLREQGNIETWANACRLSSRDSLASDEEGRPRTDRSRHWLSRRDPALSE